MAWSTPLDTGGLLVPLEVVPSAPGSVLSTPGVVPSSSLYLPTTHLSVVTPSTTETNYLDPLVVDNSTIFDALDNCTEPLGHVDWADVGMLASLTILMVVNILVVAGNCLVILAVFLSSKLRTVTNLFIASLAVSDLLLGMAVLPFSVTVEVFDTWLFGQLWCSVWLAVDVWMSTASILNLCVISFDRYVAVTRPVSYPSIMTSSRAKLLIASVWITSFVICFPPLVGWNDRHKNLVSASVAPQASQQSAEDGTGGVEGGTPPSSSCHLSCELTNDVGYVVYSALGSFFIPMLVMLFFYWKIYCAAAETTRAINQGFRTTKNKRILGSRFQEERLTLRIHRGRNSVQEHHHRNNSHRSSSTDRSFNGHSDSHRKNSQKGGKSPGIKMNTLRPQLIMKSSISLPPDMRYDGNNYALSERCDLCHAQCSRDHSDVDLLSISRKEGHSKTDSCYTVDTNFSQIDPTSQHQGNVSPTSNCASTTITAPSSEHQTRRYRSEDDGSGTPTSVPVRGRSTGASRMGRRNIKVQVKRFRMETKAAKTLGIIVGVFILCWFPFFTMYLVRGFCPVCIHPLLFSILFWLGYCNSAINPCIYALFSKDFRFAFKNILCKCICTREVRKTLPAHQHSIYIPSYDRDNDSDDDEQKR